MDPTKIKVYDDAANSGGEMTYRSLIQDALSEGNEAIASWLLDKLKAAHEGSFKDIIEEAVTNANTETEAYKPTDLAKKYWNEYFPEAEQQALSDEDLLETDDWKQSPYYSKAAQQINGWHSDADIRNLARQLRDADKKSTDNEDHFGEEQAEGLDDLLAGLKDSPHDDRW